MKLVWHLTPGHEEVTVNALKTEGAPIRGGLGFEPLTTITTVLAVTALVKALISLYRDARYKGVVIDTTRDPVEIRELPGWSRKEVLVITAEGAKFHSVGSDASASDDLSKIAELLGKA